MIRDSARDGRQVGRRRFIRYLIAGSSIAALDSLKPLERVLAQATSTQTAPGTLMVPAVPPAASTIRLTTDLGIPASAGVDVSSRITTALATLSANRAVASETLNVQLEGFYRIDKAVVLDGVKNLRLFAGPAPGGFTRFRQGLRPATWYIKTPWYQYLAIRDCENVLVEGIGIRGPLTTTVYDSDREACAGVHIEGASRWVTVRGVDITGVHGDFIMVGEFRQNQPTGILVENVTGTLAGRQMVAEVGGNGLTLRGCYFKRSGRSGIDIEPSTTLGSHNVTIENCVFEDMSLYGIAGGNETPHRNVVVKRSRFVGGRGLIKWGPPEARPVGSHRGLAMEDVVFEMRPGGYGGLTVVRTLDISLVRVTATLRGVNIVDGTGEVRDCVFRRVDGSPGVVVSLCGVSDVRNIGTGGCPEAR
jgi:hypothetical protein